MEIHSPESSPHHVEGFEHAEKDGLQVLHLLILVRVANACQHVPDRVQNAQTEQTLHVEDY